MKLCTAFAAVVFASAAIPARASIITIDENGSGFIDATPITGVLAPDPGPGGLGSVLTYTLPFTTTIGDVLMVSPSEGLNDVLRFNGNTILFYSDNLPTADSLADTPAPPGAFYLNQATITEVGPEGNNGAFYTPLAGQPGFNASNPTYHFISDGVASPTPEPASFLLMFPAAVLLMRRLTRRRRARPGSLPELS